LVEHRFSLEAEVIHLHLHPFTGLLLFGIRKQARFEIANNVGILFCDISGFTRVSRKIEQFGRAWEQCDFDEFPLPFADGAAECFNIDQDVLVRGRFAIRDRRPDVLAVEGMIRAALRAGEASSVGMRST
jgi:hypothetical protein